MGEYELKLTNIMAKVGWHYLTSTRVSHKVKLNHFGNFEIK